MEGLGSMDRVQVDEDTGLHYYSLSKILLKGLLPRTALSTERNSFMQRALHYLG